MPRRVAAIALGDTAAEARRFVAERFPGATVEWLDRRDLRRRPLHWLGRALGSNYDDALLFASDLDQPRVARLTAAVAALPRARRRWLADARGRVRPFQPGRHLRDTAPVVARHGAATASSLALARPLLSVSERLLAPGRPPRRVAGPLRRLLYLRSQFWFGLQGGGSVAHTAGVIGGLRDCGVEVRVVASDYLTGVTADTRVVRPERWFDGALKEAEEIAYNGPFFAAALREARAFRPQAIYQRYTAFSLVGALLARVLDVPLVLEFNSSDVWKGRHWGEFHRLALAETAENLQLRAADVIVVVSRVLRDELVAAGVPADRIVVNPNAVDPARFRPDVSAADVRQAHGLGDALVVGFSGTFGVWHGIPTLVAALPDLAAAHPDVRFLLVGDGPLRPLVDAAVAHHGLQGRVVLPGLVAHDRMPAYLAACDVLLSPHGRQADGREFFGSPTKLFEYMAAGRAIVASAVGQIADVLADGRTALLVPPESSEALVAAVSRLAADPALRRRLGAAAREQAEREHTWRRNAERVLTALRGHV